MKSSYTSGTTNQSDKDFQGRGTHSFGLNLTFDECTGECCTGELRGSVKIVMSKGEKDRT